MKNLLIGKKSRWMKMGGISIALLLLFALVTTGFADDVVGSLDVIAGSLTMQAVDAPAFPQITLDGTDQTTADAIEIDVKDFTGSGAGWHLQVTSTTFTNIDADTLPNTALSITSVTSACDGGTTCTNPDNSIGYPFAVLADTVAPLATEFFDAAVDSGLGDFTITPTFSLEIPATTYAGDYTSTVTFSVVSAP